MAEIPTKEGWLEKRGDWGFRWSRRYFRLTADGLLKNYVSDSVSDKPKGTFKVADWNFTKIESKGKCSDLEVVGARGVLHAPHST